MAVVGSTLLTRQLLDYLDDLTLPRLVLGLTPEAAAAKANSVDLSGHCAERGIEHHAGAAFAALADRLRELDIKTVLVFGDSRIIPPEITSHYTVIGNHGAPLPEVRGGASLVWGRMADLGWWGVSLMQLTEEIDGGDILASERFDYDPAAPMSDFVEQADTATVQAFRRLVDGNTALSANEPCLLRLETGVDSYEAVAAMREAIANGEPIYMPIRRPADAFVKPEWPPEFKRVFMIANDAPYPRWTTEPRSAGSS